MNVNRYESEHDEDLRKLLQKPEVLNMSTSTFSDTCKILMCSFAQRIDGISEGDKSNDPYMNTLNCLTASWLYTCLHLTSNIQNHSSKADNHSDEKFSTLFNHLILCLRKRPQITPTRMGTMPCILKKLAGVMAQVNRESLKNTATEDRLILSTEAREQLEMHSRLVQIAKRAYQQAQNQSIELLSHPSQNVNHASNRIFHLIRQKGNPLKTHLIRHILSFINPPDFLFTAQLERLAAKETDLEPECLTEPEWYTLRLDLRSCVLL